MQCQVLCGRGRGRTQCKRAAQTAKACWQHQGRRVGLQPWQRWRTPGRWEAKANGGVSGRRGISIRARGREIASVHYSMVDIREANIAGLVENAESVANAGVMTAAPDMFELLETIKWWLRDKTDRTPEEQGFLDRISKVLEQAGDG